MKDIKPKNVSTEPQNTSANLEAIRSKLAVKCSCGYEEGHSRVCPKFEESKSEYLAHGKRCQCSNCAIFYQAISNNTAILTEQSKGEKCTHPKEHVCPSCDTDENIAQRTKIISEIASMKSTPPKVEKVCELNCPDYSGMYILHKEQCKCSCHSTPPQSDWEEKKKMIEFLKHILPYWQADDLDDYMYVVHHYDLERVATGIQNLISQEKQKSYEEGKREALDLIAKGEGWEESSNHYAENLGLTKDNK